jgi:hypothetical protein
MMRLTEAKRSKRKRANKILRDEVVEWLIATARLGAEDRSDLLAIRDAEAELLSDWARSVATNGGKDLIRKTTGAMQAGKPMTKTT